MLHCSIAISISYSCSWGPCQIRLPNGVLHDSAVLGFAVLQTRIRVYRSESNALPVQDIRYHALYYLCSENIMIRNWLRDILLITVTCSYENNKAG